MFQWRRVRSKRSQSLMHDTRVEASPVPVANINETVSQAQKEADTQQGQYTTPETTLTPRSTLDLKMSSANRLQRQKMIPVVYPQRKIRQTSKRGHFFLRLSYCVRHSRRYSNAKS